MRRPIARIRINAGNPGWYDSLTNIHLTISRPEAIVYEGANTTNIKKGVAHKLISVVDGDLDVASVTAEERKDTTKLVREVVSQPIVQEEVIEVVAPVEETEVKVEEVITEPVEEIVEESTETVEEVEEEKPKKKSTRKKTTKKEK